MKSFKVFLLLATLMVIVFLLFSTDLFFSDNPEDREYESAFNYSSSFEVGDDSSSSSSGEFTNFRFGTDDVTEADKSVHLDSDEDSAPVNELSDTDDTDSSSREDEDTTVVNNSSDDNDSDEIVVTTTETSSVEIVEDTADDDSNDSDASSDDKKITSDEYNDSDLKTPASYEDIESAGNYSNLCITFEDGTSLYYEDNSCTQPYSTTCLNNQIRLKVDGYGSFNVPCDNNSIVIQRRMNGDEDFNRDWSEYKQGFGDLDGDFWLGLENIHAITVSGDYALIINMEDFDGNERYARYESFYIGDASDDYEVKILGKYSGDADDSLSIHFGEKFTTLDNDNDKNYNGNCAEIRGGGWWFYECDEGQQSSSLNGKYYDAESADDVTDGIFWTTFNGADSSLKYVQMSLQP